MTTIPHGCPGHDYCRQSGECVLQQPVNSGWRPRCGYCNHGATMYRSEIICAVRLDTLASFVSNVPSRSVTNRWRQASSGNMSLAILSIYFITVYVYSYGVSYVSALGIFCLIVHIDLYGNTEQKTRTVGVAFINPHLPLKQTCDEAAYMQSQSGSL